MSIDGVELLDFTTLSDEKALEILTWRNHPEVRKWMLNSGIISKDTHIQFINTLQHDKANRYFLLRKDKQKIGVVYFNDIHNEECAIGLYANPFKLKKGTGDILISTAIKYAFDNLNLKRIILEVFSDNKRAIALYKHHGFNEYKRRQINDKELICMELYNENR